MNDDDGEVLTGGKLWGGKQTERTRQWLPNQEKTKASKREPVDRTYTAFSVRDHPAALQLRRATELSRFPSYAYLLDMSYDHHLQSALTLFYSFMVVEVTGENLGPVAHAIDFRTCECLTEFHAELYDRPASGEPLVKSISVQTAKGI